MYVHALNLLAQFHRIDEASETHYLYAFCNTTKLHGSPKF